MSIYNSSIYDSFYVKQAVVLLPSYYRYYYASFAYTIVYCAHRNFWIHTHDCAGLTYERNVHGRYYDNLPDAKRIYKKANRIYDPPSRAEMNRRRCAETENTDPWRCARRRALTKHKQEKNSKYTGQHSSDTTVITLLYDRTALAVQQVFRCMRFLEISTCPEHHEIPGILGFLSRSGFPLIQEYRVGAAESAGLISLISVLP